VSEILDDHPPKNPVRSGGRWVPPVDRYRHRHPVASSVKPRNRTWMERKDGGTELQERKERKDGGTELQETVMSGVKTVMCWYNIWSEPPV
jgi:hypothetical protein